jgi:hypothetical protein
MSTVYSAGPQALGYLYQVRYGLFALLREGRVDLSVSIENLDDIDLSAATGPMTLEQLKHHLSRTATLTDTGPDIWKTLRIWSDELRTGLWDPRDVNLHLVTTATAPWGSAAWYLRGGVERDPERAGDLLIAAAGASKSQDSALQSAFTAFRNLSDPDRLRLLNAIVILDQYHDITDLEGEIRKHIRFAAPPEGQLLDRVYHELEGWWFGLVVEHLLRKSTHPIAYLTVNQKLWAITEDLQRDRLPISYADAEPDYAIDPSADSRNFVHQLRVLNVSTSRIKRAILDYYRAFEQRTSWLKDHLLIDDELVVYERRLVDAWTGLKLALEDDLLSDDAQDAACVEVGKQLLRWMETEAKIPIRRDVVDEFVMRGSFHILANEEAPRVYWHPKFLERLKMILAS